MHITSVRKVGIAFAAASTLVLAACGAVATDSVQVDSVPQIRNGKITKDFPAVVELRQYFKSNDSKIVSAGCTGTFISKNTILTAAHCVVNDGISAHAVTALGRDRKPLKGFQFLGAYVHPDYREKRNFWDYLALRRSSTVKLRALRADVALVKFAGISPAATLPLESKPLSNGEDQNIPFSMVGFGSSTWQLLTTPAGTTTIELGGGTKITGTGFINAVLLGLYLGQGLTTYAEKGKGEVGVNSSIAPGDSGGPMIRNGKVAAVASSGELESGVYVYAPVDSESLSNFYANAKRQGFLTY